MQSYKFNLVVAPLIVSGITVFGLIPLSDKATVILPMILALAICLWFVANLRIRDGELPVIDIGLFCISFTALYTIIPLLNFMFGDYSFGPLSDGRLQTYSPEPRELGLFFLNHIVYLFSLCAAYLIFRRSNRGLIHRPVLNPGSSLMIVVLIGFSLLALYYSALYTLFDIGFRSGYGEESGISEGPLWVEQVNGKLSEIQYVLMAALIGILVFHARKVSILLILSLVLVVNIALAFIELGSRGELITLILLVLLFWQKFHGMRLSRLSLYLLLGFATFMFLGLFRSFQDFGYLVSAIGGFSTLASANNEFQSLLGTGYDVHKLLEQGVEVPPILFLNDLVPLLPPQQLLPFPKLSGADWYLMQIDQYGIDVGFMWSVISQSLIGFGLTELVLRGGLLGWFLALIHSWYQKRFNRFMPTVIYIILCLRTLWTFRDTTGAILWHIWWAILPVVFLFYLLGFRKWLSKYFVSRNRPYNSSQVAPA